MSLKTFLAAVLIAACSCANAHGDLLDLLKARDIRHFRFGGTVLESLPIAPKGAKVTGTFSFDMSEEPGYLIGERAGPGYGNAAYQFPLSVTLKVNGHAMSSARTFVNVFNNSGGNVEDMLNIDGGYPLVIDGTTFPDGLIGLLLATGPGRKHVLHSTDLPRWIFPKLFNGGAYGVVQQAGGPNDTLLYFSIDSVELLPWARPH